MPGNSNPRYRWEQYWKTDAGLNKMSRPIRKYYERNNYLIQHYMYIDRLLDSSLPHNLIEEYNARHDRSIDVPDTVYEEPTPGETPRETPRGSLSLNGTPGANTPPTE